MVVDADGLGLDNVSLEPVWSPVTNHSGSVLGPLCVTVRAFLVISVFDDYFIVHIRLVSLMLLHM